MSKADQIQGLLQDPVESLGYDLIQVTLSKAKRPVLQLMIDRLDEKGVSIDDCTTVSRHVSTLLDVEDPLDGGYILEVTSPGLNRPLVRPVHFERFLKYPVKLRLVAEMEGRKQFRGVLQQVKDDGVVLALPEDTEIFFGWAQIAQAKLALDPPMPEKVTTPKRPGTKEKHP